MSASNAAKAYDMVLSSDYVKSGEWQFVPRLRTEQVWDTFVLVSLLDDKMRYQQQLLVPHTGMQKDRFTEAMEERNRDIIYNGQPNVVRHACDKCFRTYKTASGEIRESLANDIYLVYVDANFLSGKAHPIVGDGLNMGRPCCGVFRCPEPLQSNRHRFCRTHFDEHQKCAIIGCEEPVTNGDATDEESKTCSDARHKKMEAQNKEKNAAMFILKERFQKTQISHPTDFFATDNTTVSTPELLTGDPVQEHQEWFEVSDEGQVTIRNEPHPGTIGVDDGATEPCPSKAPTGNRAIVRAQFGRRRTHNEQTLVRPCGIIFARATMFGAEAVSNFLVRQQTSQ